MRDAMQTILSPESRDQIMEAWRIAAGEHVNVDGEVAKLRKQNILSKSDGEALAKLVRSEQRIEVIPQTEDPESKLRFGQALAWLAQSNEGEKRLELEQAAGNYLRN
jgi:hypothetical protein